MQDQKLMEHFNFDEFDLAANSEGRFTERQKTLLNQEDLSNRRKERKTGILYILYGWLFAAIALGLSFYMKSVFHMTIDWLTDIILHVLLVGLVPLFMTWLGLLIIKTSFTRKRDLTLHNVQGPVKHVTRDVFYGAHARDGYYTVDELHVEDVIFTVDEHINKVMKNGDRYNIYYANIAASDNDEDFKKIISAELT